MNRADRVSGRARIRMGRMLYEHEIRERRHRSAVSLLVGVLLIITFGANLFVAFGIGGGGDIELTLYGSAMAALLCGIVGWCLAREVRARIWWLLPALVVRPQSPLILLAVGLAPEAPAQLSWVAGSAVLQLVVFVACAIVSDRKARRTSSAVIRCGVCGYDLTGLPADAPCPECGGVVPSEHSKQA